MKLICSLLYKLENNTHFPGITEMKSICRNEEKEYELIESEFFTLLNEILLLL